MLAYHLAAFRVETADAQSLADHRCRLGVGLPVIVEETQKELANRTDWNQLLVIGLE